MYSNIGLFAYTVVGVFPLKSYQLPKNVLFIPSRDKYSEFEALFPSLFSATHV